MATLSDIIRGVTEPQYEKQLMDELRSRGVPVDSWLDTSNIGLSLTKWTSAALAELRGSSLDPATYQGVTYLAQSAFLQYASGAGLTALSESQYQNTRQLASTTQGTIWLIASITASPQNILPGKLIIGSTLDPKLTYTNVTGGPIAPGGILDLVFRATVAGAKFNVSNTHPMVLKTPLPGISVSTPLYPPGVSWITSSGSDEESDAQLKKRDIYRWSTIGAGANAEALKYGVLLPPPGYLATPVKNVRVLENFAVNSLGTGQWPNCATIVIGGDTGALVPADKAAVIANFYATTKIPIGVHVYFVDMSVLTVLLSLNIDVYKESGVTADTITTQVTDSIADFESFIELGEIITPQKIGARAEDGNKIAIKNVSVVSPATTITPTYNQKIKFQILSINVRIV